MLPARLPSGHGPGANHAPKFAGTALVSKRGQASIGLLRKCALAGAIGILLCTGSALAGESGTGAVQVSATPYLWAAGLHGDVTVRGQSASVDASFIDTVKEADSILGFQGHLEIRRDRLGGFLDVTYLDIGEDDISAGPFSLDATQNLTLVEFGLLYRVADLPSPSSDGAGLGTRVDAYAGGRYTNVGVELDFDRLGEFERDKDWVDPIVGTRVVTDLSRDLQIVVGGDVGGFGAGSDFTWSALGLLGYRFDLFGREATALAGYRALAQDYDSGSGPKRFEWDVMLRGPVFGLMVRF